MQYASTAALMQRTIQYKMHKDILLIEVENGEVGQNSTIQAQRPHQGER
jgi:hypothetical protein